MNTNLLFIVCGVALLGMIVCFFLGRQSVFRSEKYQQNERDLSWCRKTYLWKVGIKTKYGEDESPYAYRLFSPDGGETWYTVDLPTGTEVNIQGKADPKLVKVLNSDQALMDFILDQHKE